MNDVDRMAKTTANMVTNAGHEKARLINDAEKLKNVIY